MAGDAPYIINDVGGVAAAVFSHTNKIKQAAIRNLHATQTLTVKVFTGNTSAAAAAAAVATPAVIGADDVFTIGPVGQRTVVMKSRRSVFVSLSVIASGAGTTFTSEGTLSRDGA